MELELPATDGMLGEPHHAADRLRARHRLACALVGGLALTCGGLLIALRIANGGSEPVDQNWWLAAWFVVSMVYGVAGTALLFRPGHRLLGSCFLVIAAAATTSAIAIQFAAFATTHDIVGWSALADADRWARPLGAAVLVGIVPWRLLSPVSRDRRWYRPVLVATATATAVVVVGAAARGMDRASTWAAWLVTVSATAGTVLLAVRWRRDRVRGDPLPGWILAGAVLAWLAVVPHGLDLADWHMPGEDVVWALLLAATVTLLVAGVVIQALREVPTRFHGVSHRVVEWTILSAGIVVLYAGVVAGLGRLVGGSGPTWLLVAATGAIAVGLEPVRHGLRRLVDGFVFGSRDDPLTVVQRIVDHLGADAGDDLLPSLVVSLQHELRLDAVAIDLRVADGWQRAAAVGPSTSHERSIDLHHGGAVVGRLVVGSEDGPYLRERDEQVLAQLAGPLSLAVGWVRLAADLRRSSLAVVSAREEERRRLRRDLHDGLGPALTGVSLGLRTSIRQLERHPSHQEGAQPSPLLERVADEVDASVAELKRIVRDLRPTALDQLGLIGALAEFSRTFGDDLQIVLSLPAGPVELPAAVEVAIYRIVTEAVTNVVRHAGAARCWLTIAAGTTVEIDVVDDGSGIAIDAGSGVGLTAMCERAAELGGTVQVLPNSPCGTRVHVRLPAALP